MKKNQVETKKGQFVTKKHVDNLVENYKQSRWLDNSRKIKKTDSLSTWFGVDELESFISTAKANNADGIKIYFGVYPSEYPEFPDFADRQTVVLVATRSTNQIGRTMHKSIAININGKKDILAMNFGTICPPYCGGGTGGFTENLVSIETDNVGISFKKIDGKIHLL